jgi:heme exporter protein C
MSDGGEKRTATGLAPWKWALLPGMAAVIAMCYLWAGDLTNFISPRTARIIFWHVPMAMLSMLWFFVAAFYAGRYLVQRQGFDDTRAAKGAEVGLILTILATVTGAVFSKMQWAGGLASPWYEGYWQWDPKQTAIVVVIVIFAAYFGLRMSIDDPGKRARISSAYLIVGAALVPVFYYVLPHLPVFTSLHPTDVVRRGMDTPYRTTFWLSTLMFLGVSVWTYQIQLRLARVEERLAARQGAPAAVRVEAVRRPAAET